MDTNFMPPEDSSEGVSSYDNEHDDSPTSLKEVKLDEQMFVRKDEVKAIEKIEQ